MNKQKIKKVILNISDIMSVLTVTVFFFAVVWSIEGSINSQAIKLYLIGMVIFIPILMVMRVYFNKRVDDKLREKNLLD